MTALPLSTAFTDSAVTEGEFKTAITNQREFLAGLLGADGEVATALAALGALGADTVTKTANYTVLTSDRGKVILCSGTFTLSLTAAATLADGFTFAVINTGSGIITIDPNSTEQIDGANTKEIGEGGWAVITCTGSAFWTMGTVPATGSLIGYQVFTSSGTYTKATNNPSFVIVEVVGGGGGQTGAGGTSSFGAFCSATGGATANTGSTSGSAGGSGSGGDLNLSGGRGIVCPVGGGGSIATGVGFASGGSSFIQGRGTGSGAGTSVNGSTSVTNVAGGGGGGYSREKILASSLAASETVTVGASGNGAGTVAATAGVVIVWEYR